jgi:hypothetical protein
MSARDIIAVCQRNIALYPDDCSAFVRAVATACGVLVTGDANSIVSSLDFGERLADGMAAQKSAATGDLVIAGLQAPGHGHVVVVVDGPLRGGRYPYSFWGQYRGMIVGGKTMNVGFTRGHGTLNYAFNPNDRDRVKYAAFKPIETILPRANWQEGFLIHTFT